MSPRFVLGRENVPCIAEVVNMSLKADCTDFISGYSPPQSLSLILASSGTNILASSGMARSEERVLQGFDCLKQVCEALRRRVILGDIMSTLGECHEYTEGCSEHRRDIMIYIIIYIYYLFIMSTSRGYNGSCGGANG